MSQDKDFLFIRLLLFSLFQFLGNILFRADNENYAEPQADNEYSGEFLAEVSRVNIDGFACFLMIGFSKGWLIRQVFSRTCVFFIAVD